MDYGQASEVTDRFLQAQDQLVLNASDLPLETIASMVDQGKIDIEPSFQRRSRWKAPQRSALIESFLLNIPVPPIYLAEERNGIYSVIDGKQRIATIRDFMRDEIRLRNLEMLPELNGAVASELPDELRSALSLRPYVRAVFLLKQSDSELKFIAFHRLNTGGEPLNNQEIRNNAYSGPLNDLLHSLSRDPFLRRQLKIHDDKSSNYVNMYDCETVLRFFTLSDTWRDFKGSFRHAFDRYMAEHRYADSATLGRLEGSYEQAIRTVSELWGDAAFQRPEGQGWRDQFIAGLFDAQMIAVQEASPTDLQYAIDNQPKVMADTRALFKNEEFTKAVRSATNTPRSVRLRIESVLEILRAP